MDTAHELEDEEIKEEHEGNTQDDSPEEKQNDEEKIELIPSPVKVDVTPMGLEFHPEEQVLASSFIDGTVKLYSWTDKEDFEEVWSKRLFKKSCRAVRFMEDGKSVFGICKDKSWKIFDANNGKTSRQYPNAHDASIYSVVIAGTNFVVTGDDDGTLKAWDLRKEHAVFEARESEEFLSDLAIDDKNKIVLATSGDGTLLTFNIKRRRFDLQSEHLNSELMCVQIIRRGQKVICGASDGALNIFNWDEFGCISDRFPGHPESVDFCSKVTDKLICTGSSDGKIRAVHFYPHRFLGVVGDHGDMPINNLTISHDESVLASCGPDQKIKFWDMERFHTMAEPKKQKSKKSDVNKLMDEPENFFADLV